MNDIVKMSPASGGVVLRDAMAPAVLDFIKDAATNPNVDVAKMSALLDLQERLLAKQAEVEFNAAFTAMALQLPKIKKDGTVYYPVDKNHPRGPKEKAFKFATYEDLDAAIRPVLHQHGFVLSHKTVAREGGGLTVIGILRHAGGHSESTEMPLPLDTSGGKNNLQAAGSTISYGRRYTAQTLLNLVFEGEDDDGERGGTEFIGEAERKRINDLIEEMKIPLAAFLDYMLVDSVAQIQTKDFAKAINALMAKKRKAGAPA